ncbi:MAG: L-seryl-tRNA(Sec) selenium transferase [Gemmatimonadales bacterium]|nr:L-seryl-tRNA(Sec) selenium transferase [Gemmatimonadales bacterium]MDG2240746.1 L-seryl-tRNA(Sec) selenium transferase [Longimicrobiales bacterium]
MTDPRRSIPSVDALLAAEEFVGLVGDYGHERVVAAARRVLDAVRGAIAAGDVRGGLSEIASYVSDVADVLERDAVPSLREVVNATGVVLHTNLGRAPLADVAAQAMAAAARGYSNLEYDIDAGARGSRYDHCVSLLRELTGAEDALVVNNNAAALVLALNTLARGQKVVVSRGELVEIGGGFRIPDILERSGAGLVEVGSTNRTRIADYRGAVENGGVAAILKVHRSNFRITGFTEDVEVAELSDLAREAGVPLIHDLGSGLFVRAEELGLPEEPLAVDSLKAGADVVAVSGDKLLGGPQAGLLLGSKDHIAALRANPLCRALRVDKMTLAGLEATLRLYRDRSRALVEIPTLRMLGADVQELSERAESMASALSEAGVSAEVVDGMGAVGGGTYPGVTLDSAVVALPTTGAGASEVAARLRAGSPPVVARIVSDRVVLDPRTVLPGQEVDVIRVVVEAIGPVSGAP